MIAEYQTANMTYFKPSDMIPTLYLVNLICLILQTIGMLSNPFVTILYLMEQASIFGFGSTSRASDLRIVVSFIVDCGLCALLWVLEMEILCGIFAYLSCSNYMHSCALRKPFVPVNEEMRKKKGWFEIVFRDLELTSYFLQDKRVCSPWMILVGLLDLILTVAAIMAPIMLMFTEE